MKKIFSIAWNDIKIEFSDRMTLVFFLVLPVVFTIVIGLGLSGLAGSESVGDSRYPVVVVDLDNSPLSAELVETIAVSQVIRPEQRTAAQADQLFEDDEALAVLTVPQGFEAGLMAGEPVELALRKAQDDNRVLAIEQAVGAAVSQVERAVQIAHTSLEEALNLRTFETSEEEQAYFQDSLERAQELLGNPPAKAATIYSAVSNVTQIATGFTQSSPGQIVTWTLITLLGASEVFVNERLGGTLRRLLVTPTTKAIVMLGKICGRLGLGLLQMVLLVGFGAFVLGVEYGNSWTALALIILAFSLAAVALGVLLGAFSRTRSQASGLTVMLSMLMAALGGAWWPMEVTPTYYQQAVRVLPTTWAMAGFTDVIVRGQGVAGILPEVGVLLAFAAVFFAVGVWRLRFE
jgi:ABC-2 type transport system permease protein